MGRSRSTSIRHTRRDGRDVYVFRRNDTDVFELVEVPPRFDDPREWGRELADDRPSPPPLPRPQVSAKDDRTWSRTSITGLARKLNSM
jgi:hypothetical protein